MGKKGFRTLRMVERPMAHTTPRGPDGKAPAVEKVAWAVAILGGFVDNLEREGTCHSDSFLPNKCPKSMTLDLQNANCKAQIDKLLLPAGRSWVGGAEHLNTGDWPSVTPFPAKQQATYLIKGRENVVGKLDFRNSRGTGDRDANAKSNNSLFTQRGVKHSVFSFKRKWLNKVNRNINIKQKKCHKLKQCKMHLKMSVMKKKGDR